jgi:hypothetical protein
MTTIAFDPLIAEAKRRAHRRRYVLALVLLLAGAAAYSIFRGEGSPAPRQVASPVARCSVAALSVSVSFQGALQSEMGGFAITNTGEAACSLPTGVPRLAVIWHGRNLVVANHAEGRPGISWRLARRLAPGKTSYVFLRWFDGIGAACFKPSPAANKPFTPRLVLHFAHGFVLSATASNLSVPNCGTTGGSIEVTRAFTQ